MKLTTDEAKHIIRELEDRQSEGELCDTETGILFKARKAYPLAVAELELEIAYNHQRTMGKYNRELVQALEDGKTWEEFSEEKWGAK